MSVDNGKVNSLFLNNTFFGNLLPINNTKVMISSEEVVKMIFDKERFSKLLSKAKGKRSINNFGRISQVDPGYISRLLRCQINTPPSAAIISKLGSKAHNNVSDIELMIAAGYIDEGSEPIQKDIVDEGNSLSKESLEIERKRKYLIDKIMHASDKDLPDLAIIVNRVLPDKD